MTPSGLFGTLVNVLLIILILVAIVWAIGQFV